MLIIESSFKKQKIARFIAQSLAIWIPEYPTEIQYGMVPDLNSFTFQQLLHEVGTLEMMLSREETLPVDDPVRRDGFVDV